MGLTTDRHDGCLHEINQDTGMQRCYLIAPDGKRKNLVRPVFTSYVHETCGTQTWMARELAETYAANPRFYGGTYCAFCRAHYPVGHEGRFVWPDGTLVGTMGMTVADRDRFRIEHDMGPLPAEVAR
jgi:hypothetical protein